MPLSQLASSLGFHLRTEGVGRHIAGQPQCPRAYTQDVLRVLPLTARCVPAGMTTMEPAAQTQAQLGYSSTPCALGGTSCS